MKDKNEMHNSNKDMKAVAVQINSSTCNWPGEREGGGGSVSVVLSPCAFIQFRS